MEAFVLLFGFAVGAVPFGYLISRARGVDIRMAGSGSIGATNVLRTLGVGPGLLVFALDVLKGLAPALIAHQLQLSVLIALLAGIAAVLGHSFSPFLGLKGGKGIATGLGALLGALPVVGLICFGVFFLVMAASMTVSLSSIAAAVAAPLVAYAIVHDWRVIAVLALIAAVVVYLHRSNLQRIGAGREPVFGQKQGEPRPNTVRGRLVALFLGIALMAISVLVFAL